MASGSGVITYKSLIRKKIPTTKKPKHPSNITIAVYTKQIGGGSTSTAVLPTGCLLQDKHCSDRLNTGSSSKHKTTLSLTCYASQQIEKSPFLGSLPVHFH